MLTRQTDLAHSKMVIGIDKLLDKSKRKIDKRQDGDYVITLKLRDKIDAYLRELEQITGREITCKQIELIKDYVRNNEVHKSDVVQYNKSRREFHQSCRNLRKEWEVETGQEWPKYEEDVYMNGVCWKSEGDNYDAHHIVELRFGGPNVWYNIFPAANPTEHQDAIHAETSICTEIFDCVGFVRNKGGRFKVIVPEIETSIKKVKEIPKESKITKIAKNIIRIH
ncbi:MAG: hypothetical protein J6Y29_02485 [Clostridiales bacterium]|nr:hypothetical protein [Clostridiales bacterium]